MITTDKTKDEPLLVNLIDKEQFIFLRGILKNLSFKRGFKTAEIFLKDPNTRELIKVLHTGNQMKELWKSSRFAVRGGYIDKAVRQKSIVVFTPSEDMNLSPAAKAAQIERIACFPLKEKESSVFGVLCLASASAESFKENELNWLNTFCTVVSFLITRETQHSLQERIAILKERERIGMDLHDGIIQALYATGLNLQNISIHLGEDKADTNQRLNQAIQALDDAIRNIRAYILDLRPRQLQSENLLQGIHSLVREFRANTLVEVELEGEEKEVEKLPSINAMALFHIFQEALANIAKHAEARKVNIRLSRVDERVMLRVSDDGVGFNPAKVGQHIGHGLSNMQTRAQNVGGGIEIISIRKQGTTILAWVPIS
jgi:two-component system sensor histidine kinase DevS